uniref:glucuronosyltransferase n=1 Tax=Podarcis muralis TaxID=64176 RepID=A0A670JRB2_PODMU
LPTKMKNTLKSVAIQLLILQLALVGNIFCGNVLIWPEDASHWLNIKVIIQELLHRGHNVSILAPSASILIEPSEDISAAKFEVFPVPYGKDEAQSFFEEFVTLLLDHKPTALTFYRFYQEMRKMMRKVHEFHKFKCENVLADQELMARLKKSNYDVLLADPATPCGDLIAVKMDIPFVYTLQFTPGLTVERHCGKIPAPPSYAPAVLSGLTDKMSFGERVKNIISYLVQDHVFQTWYGDWDSYYSQVLGRPTTQCEVMGKAEIWLIRTYWDLEFPRPLLPNFEFVGGLQCQPAKPLPEEMEEFVQSSGEHGIVVFSLGSLVANLTDEKSNIVASALSQLPQKVLWRHKGKIPETLGANTRIYDWIPQNDLLGHPKTKAFITHGGINGIYEAIYHGVPTVGIPMFADQPDNIQHMKAKGMAVGLDIQTMEAEDLVHAVKAVILNATYKENALRLSQIHHDQLLKPLDRAVFWIEFVMRHKGAKHLRVAAHHLTWYQYHSLDAIAFLIGCMAVFTFIAVKCCLCCLLYCRKRVRIIMKTKTE